MAAGSQPGPPAPGVALFAQFGFLMGHRRGVTEPMRILVIEDEMKTAKFLKKGLSEAGFVVDVARDGLEGLHLAQEIDFDLLILNMMSARPRQLGRS